jgi:hypothetical protein
MTCKIVRYYKFKKIYKMYAFYILVLKSGILDAWGWPGWPKHVACIDETNETFKFVLITNSMHNSFIL